MAKTEGIGEQEVIDGEICKKRTFSDPEKCINAFMFLREAWNSDRSIGYYSAYSKFDQLIKDYSGSLAPSVDSYSGTLTGSGK